MTNNKSAETTPLVGSQLPGFAAMEVLNQGGVCLNLVDGELTTDGSQTLITVNLHPFPIGDLVTWSNMTEHQAAHTEAGEDQIGLKMSADWRWGFDADDTGFRMSGRNKGEILSGNEIVSAKARLVLVEYAARQAFHFVTLDR